MARDFTVYMDVSRLSSETTITLQEAIVPQVNGLLPVDDGMIPVIPQEPKTLHIVENIPFIQQINGPASLKNTFVSYKINAGNKDLE